MGEEPVQQETDVRTQEWRDLLIDHQINSKANLSPFVAVTISEQTARDFALWGDDPGKKLINVISPRKIRNYMNTGEGEYLLPFILLRGLEGVPGSLRDASPPY